MTHKGGGDKPKPGLSAGRRRLNLKKETMKDLGAKKDQEVRGGAIITSVAECVTAKVCVTIVCRIP